MMNKVNKISRGLVVCGLVALSAASSAQSGSDIPEEAGMFYYELGGARAFAFAPSRKRTARIRLNPYAELGYSCGRFDLRDTVENSLNELKQGVDEFGDMLYAAAGEAIASLPMYILYRADPQMAETLQNAYAGVKKQYQIAMDSCEQMERDIASGGNPYASWVEYGKSVAFRNEAEESQNADATEAKQKAIQRGACDGGIGWVGGTKRGGSGQETIHIVEDVVIAGYNILAGRDVLDRSNLGDDPETNHLKSVWESPEEAAEWAISVIGEREISLCDNETASTPGRGLHPFAEEELTRTREELDKIIDESVYVDYEEKIDSPVAISPYLIAKVKAEPVATRELIKDRLASEVALNTIIDRGLLMKRVITTGRREPNIEAAGPAIKEIDNVIQTLDSAIKDMLFESEVRSRMVRNTARMIIDRRARAEAEGRLPAPGTAVEDRPLEGGAVRKEE